MHGLLRRLFAPRWQHPDPEVRRKALQSLDPQHSEQREALLSLASDSDSDIQLASLDHAIWFHRPFRADEWLLYSQDSPNASGARGFCRGSFFTREGVLVASTAQEGLIRKRETAFLIK